MRLVRICVRICVILVSACLFIVLLPIHGCRGNRPVLSRSAERLFQDYLRNEVSADSMYKGKTLAVTGTVASIEKGFTGVYLMLKTSNLFMPVQANLRWWGEDSKVSTLSAADWEGGCASYGGCGGSIVTVVCEGDGSDSGSPILTDCVISNRNSKDPDWAAWDKESAASSVAYEAQQVRARQATAKAEAEEQAAIIAKEKASYAVDMAAAAESGARAVAEGKREQDAYCSSLHLREDSPDLPPTCDSRVQQRAAAMAKASGSVVDSTFLAKATAEVKLEESCSLSRKGDPLLVGPVPPVCATVAWQ